MNDLNTVKINDTFFNKVTFGKNISVKNRNGVWYIDGWIYLSGKGERVHKSTFKKATKPERKYIEKNKETILWELSNTKRDLDMKRNTIGELFTVVVTKIINILKSCTTSLQRKRRVS